jgi:Fic family protein
MALNKMLEEIDSIKQQVEALQPTDPGLESKFWEKFRLEFNYNSNHLEGNTLTYDHTKLLLLFDKIDGDYTLRELEEMKAHDVAFKVTKDGALEEEDILTEKFIKELNKTILVRPFYKEAITLEGHPTRRLIEPGQYKIFPNSVRLENGEIFHYTSPENTPMQMGDLVDWYRKETDNKQLHAVQIAALFHYKFVVIHPFDDGNGRTSRLLMNYLLIRNGYAPAVIESVDKKNYLSALNKADTGNIEAFVEYIAKLTLKWQKLFLKAISGESIEEPGDFEKDLHVLKKKIQNSHDKIETVLTYEAFAKLESDLFPEFIISLIEKLSTFDDLFVDATLILSRSAPLGKHGQVDLIMSEKPKNAVIPPNLLTSRYWTTEDGNPYSPQSLDISYAHKYLKNKRTADFSYTNRVEFVFNRGGYVVKIDDFQIDKRYNEKLEYDEIKILLEKIAKNELAAIKKALK